MSLRLNALSMLKEQILQQLPADAGITRIDFEGPEIAIYTKNPSYFAENGEMIRNVVRTIKKRVVVRSDPDVRKTPEETEREIKSIVPVEAEVTNVSFDGTIGEVIIEAKKPGLVIGRSGTNLKLIVQSTNWRPTVIRTPPIRSVTVAQALVLQQKESAYKQKFLKAIGQRIHRHTLTRTDWVRMTALGGFQEVGRSCILIQTNESNILVDCGLKPGGQGPADTFPRLDLPDFDISRLDAVILTHAHLDHCGFIPYLFKYGYRGPVYCTRPTQNLATLLQLDYLNVANKEGIPPVYSLKNVRRTLLHTVPLEYGEVTDIAPDIKLTLHNAGHILGSAMVHLHIGEGLHNIVLTGDFKFSKTKLLESSTYMFPRIETLVMETTYGNPNDIQPTREEAEGMFAMWVKQTLERGGKVLLPSLAVGRSQEIMMILEEAIRSKMMPEVPIYIEGLVEEATAIHTAYPEYLAHEIRDKIFHEGVNPFLSEYFVRVDDKNARSEIVEGGPCVIMATSGMLNGGPALEYLKLMGPEPLNSLIFTCYQIPGTLGNRIQRGLRELQFPMMNGKLDVVKMSCEVHSAEGFSGHSDYRQLMRFLQRVSPKPETIITVHGEKSKTIGFANGAQRIFHVRGLAPAVMESTRLC